MTENYCPKKARATLNVQQFSDLVRVDESKAAWSRRKKERAERQLEFHVANCEVCWKVSP